MRLDLNYLVLVALSTIVAAIDLVENNVAVVLGALWPFPVISAELLARTDVGLSSVALYAADSERAWPAASLLSSYRDGAPVERRKQADPGAGS